jgi:hypothetical protein
MACKTDNFKFDPDKTALENLFALVYRTNRARLDPNAVEVETPRAIETDEHGDNTIILVKAKAGGPFKGQQDMYYARANIDNHYPTFTIDAKETYGINDKDALIAYLDGKFNLVDGEFDVDVEGPFDSLAQFTSIDIFAKEESYIYVGRKTIHIFWSAGLRRVDDEGRVRVTDEGVVRTIDDETLD